MGTANPIIRCCRNPLVTFLICHRSTQRCSTSTHSLGYYPLWNMESLLDLVLADQEMMDGGWICLFYRQSETWIRWKHNQLSTLWNPSSGPPAFLRTTSWSVRSKTDCVCKRNILVLVYVCLYKYSTLNQTAILFHFVIIVNQREAGHLHVHLQSHTEVS